MSSDTLLQFALGHARKRLRLDDDDGDLLTTMIDSAIGIRTEAAAATGEAGASAATTGEAGQLGPSATSQLLALLVASVNSRPEVISVDEPAAPSDQDDAAEAASDDEESCSCTPPQASSSCITALRTEITSRGTAARTRRLTTYRLSELTEPQRLAATNAKALPAAVRELLAEGADANARDADGNCPLWLALHIPSGRAALEVLHALLRRGARANCSRHGASMLHHAALLRRPPLAQRLLRDGAVPFRVGRGPSSRRTSSRHPTPRRLPAALQLASLAATHGFGDEAEQHVRRALATALVTEETRHVFGLIEHGYGSLVTPAMLLDAVKARRSVALITALLSAGADPNSVDELGTHPLTLAALHGDCGAVRALLEAGASPLAVEDGVSIVEYARRHAASDELLELLERPGRFY